MEYKDYIELLSDMDKLRVQFIQDRGEVVRFVVQYYARIGPRWRTVMRADNYHGAPHLHVYHLRGGEHRVQLEYDANQAFTRAKDGIKRNFGTIKENFLFSS